MIRRATLNDLEVIADLEREIFLDPIPFDFLKNDFLNNSSSVYFVAEVDKKVCGYTFFWISDTISINNFCISKEYRRLKLGTYLMEEVIKMANNLELLNIILEVRTSNIAAINFYKKFDFKEVYVRPKYYKNNEDALVMIRGEL